MYYKPKITLFSKIYIILYIIISYSNKYNKGIYYIYFSICIYIPLYLYYFTFPRIRVRRKQTQHYEMVIFSRLSTDLHHRDVFPVKASNRKTQ